MVGSRLRRPGDWSDLRHALIGREITNTMRSCTTKLFITLILSALLQNPAIGQPPIDDPEDIPKPLAKLGAMIHRDPNSRSRIESITLTDRNLHDLDLNIIGQFPETRRLHLRHNPITDRGLVNLSVLSQLTELELSETLVVDLSTVGPLLKLKFLDLEYSTVNDSIAGFVRKCPSLGVLNLGYTDVGDAFSPRYRAA